jgi:integrase/recombinase XerD
VTSLAPLLQTFFTERLIQQRNASPHTVASYRDTYRLLLTFAQERTGKAPYQLDIAELDAVLIGAFLAHLETDRGVSVRSRNARLTAIRSLFSYAALRHPEHAAVIQRVLAIPPKRFTRNLVTFLTAPEIDALLQAPDRTRWIGRRDHALLVVAVQTGLRVSELTALTIADLELGTGAHLRCMGKGRKQRITPLTRATRAVLTTWLKELRGEPTTPIFPGPAGQQLSRDAVRRLLSRHVRTATDRCPTLATKTISPHTLRHSCAMTLRAAGVDISVIALWLGHADIRTAQIYLHADLAVKERALARTTPPDTRPGRYHPSDTLLAFLEGL